MRYENRKLVQFDIVASFNVIILLFLLPPIFCHRETVDETGDNDVTAELH